MQSVHGVLKLAVANLAPVGNLAEGGLACTKGTQSELRLGVEHLLARTSELRGTIPRQILS